MDFANEYIPKPLEFRKCYFMYEIKFCIFGIKRKKLIWRKTRKGYEKENMLPTCWKWYYDLGLYGNQRGKLTFIDSIIGLGIIYRNFEKKSSAT